MWYIIYVKGGQEEKISHFLGKRGLLSFVPTKEKYFRSKGVVKVVKEKLFPNYVFIDSDLDCVAFSGQIQDIKQQKEGLIKEIRFDLEGTPSLRDEEVKLLERLLGVKRNVATSVGFIENDQVYITEGPLMGFESKIVHINRHKRIAKLEVEMLGSVRTVAVSLEIVSKI